MKKEWIFSEARLPNFRSLSLFNDVADDCILWHYFSLLIFFIFYFSSHFYYYHFFFEGGIFSFTSVSQAPGVCFTCLLIGCVSAQYFASFIYPGHHCFSQWNLLWIRWPQSPLKLIKSMSINDVTQISAVCFFYPRSASTTLRVYPTNPKEASQIEKFPKTNLGFSLWS